MPIFRFSVSDGQTIPYDRNLADLEAAYVEAVDMVGALLRDRGTRYWNGENWHVDVADQAGAVLFRLNFTASLSPTNRPST